MGKKGLRKSGSKPCAACALPEDVCYQLVSCVTGMLRRIKQLETKILVISASRKAGGKRG